MRWLAGGGKNVHGRGRVLLAAAWKHPGEAIHDPRGFTKIISGWTWSSRRGGDRGSGCPRRLAFGKQRVRSIPTCGRMLANELRPGVE